jgi:hypothetical protein
VGGPSRSARNRKRNSGIPPSLPSGRSRCGLVDLARSSCADRFGHTSERSEPGWRKTQAGAPGNGAEEDRPTGKDPEHLGANRDADCQRGAGPGRDQRGRARAGLRCGTSWADRERCRCGDRAEGAMPRAAWSYAGAASGRSGTGGASRSLQGAARRGRARRLRFPRRNDRKARAHAGGVAREGSSSRGEGSQGGAVDQAEHHQGEAERPHTSGTAGIAADDRDPDDIVEPPRKCHPHDRSAPVRSREGERRRPVACCEEPAPAVGL